MKIRQKIDKAAFDQLEKMVSSFPHSWNTGACERENGKYSFNGFGENCAVSVKYDAKKQLIGGVYSLIFTMEQTNLSVAGEAEITLHYKGRLLKGAAYFTDKNKDSVLSGILNGDEELISCLSELDLLSMTIFFSEETLKVNLSPMGGAYTYTLFPPMKHGALLPDKDLELIRKALARISALFPSAGLKRVSGGEEK